MIPIQTRPLHDGEYHMMDVDTSSEDEIGSEVSTFVGEQTMDSFPSLTSPDTNFQLSPESDGIANFYLPNIIGRNSADLGAMDYQPMHYAQPLEQTFIENFANLEIADYSRRDSGVDLASNDYPLNYYLNHEHHVYYNA